MSPAWAHVSAPVAYLYCAVNGRVKIAIALDFAPGADLQFARFIARSHNLDPKLNLRLLLGRPAG